MPKRTAHFPPNFDFNKLPHLEASTGIRFSGDESELQVQNEAVTAQPSPLISDGSIVLDEDVSPLLQLINIVPEIIENIASKLDPLSFVNLACCCTELYNFFSRPTARNHIDIPLKEEKLTLEREGRNRRLIVTYKSELVPIPMGVGGLDFRKCVGMIRKWPFSVHVDKLSFEDFGEAAALPEARAVLERLGAVSIQEMQSNSRMAYVDLISLIDRYRVKKVDLMGSGPTYTEDEWSALAQKPLEVLYIDEFPLKLLLSTSIPAITVDNGYDNMNKALFQSIVQKWLVADDLVRWELGSSMSVEEVISSFSNFSFLPQDFTGPMPPLRPLLFRPGQRPNIHDDDLEMFILRDDGLLLKISDCRQMQEITLTFWPLDDGRPALYPQ